MLIFIYRRRKATNVNKRSFEMSNQRRNMHIALARKTIDNDEIETFFSV